MKHIGQTLHLVDGRSVTAISEENVKIVDGDQEIERPWADAEQSLFATLYEDRTFVPEPQPPHVMYSQSTDGTWTKITFKGQCGEKIIMAGECQGAAGHDGDHWCYNQVGDYCFYRNAADSQGSKIAGGWCPEGSKGYLPPSQKQSYHSSPVTEPVIDEELIKFLEGGGTPEGCSVNCPVDMSELEGTDAADA